MKNWVQAGHVLTLTAPAGGVVSGQPFAVGALVGVAATDAAAGAPVETTVAGVFELTKASGEAWAAGTPVYLGSDGKLTTTAAGNTRAGIAVEAAASAATVGKVLLGR